MDGTDGALNQLNMLGVWETLKAEKEYVTLNTEPEPWVNQHISLNPHDPFEAALISIVETNRRKRRDYAEDGSPFSNFQETSSRLGMDGFGARESALFNVLQKLARLTSLRKNGRMNDTANETVDDTFLDLAVYAIITYAIHMQEVNGERN
jgi:hypothetical protein